VILWLDYLKIIFSVADWEGMCGLWMEWKILFNRAFLVYRDGGL